MSEIAVGATMGPVVGSPFRLVEASAAEYIAGLGPWTAVVHDPPWSAMSGSVPAPTRLIHAWDMEVATLEALVEGEPDTSEVIVGIGGGTAADTAKYLAWKTGKRFVQVPTIISVDAAMTESVGVRVDGRVRYHGSVEPEAVIIDLPLIRTAPARLNRAGVGDILSCHTGLDDWRRGAAVGRDAPWRTDLAALSLSMLEGLDAAAEDINARSDDGLRFMAESYALIGGACREATHARFEEGSEHFLAYAHEHRTGAHLVHGELVSFGVVAMSTMQGNKPAWAADVIRRAGVLAHPDHLGISREDLDAALLGLRDYCRAESLWWSVADEVPIDGPDDPILDTIWSAVSELPGAAR